MGRIVSQEIEYSGITLSQQSLPIGAIVPYMGTTAPSGYLACDGGVYNISLYPLLAGFIQTQFGSIDFFGGDGTTTFAVPDLRGEFLRGAGTNSHANQGDGAGVGEHQDATEEVNISGDSAGYIYAPEVYTASPKNADSTIIGNNLRRKYTLGGTDLSIANFYTSRPTNTSVLYIIKATPDRLDKITFAEVDDTSVSSDAVWSAEKIQGILNTICAPNAGAHNGIYRGKYLGSGVTSAQYDAIDAGTFDDLFIGDYWTIGGVNYRIAAFDYWLHCGDTECTKHHAVIIPDDILYEAKMNDSDTTSGGYTRSKMKTTNLASAVSTINSAFPNLVLTHREYLTNAVSNNNPSGGAWVDSAVELPNEYMLYGSYIFTPGILNGVISVRQTIDKSQLALFALRPDLTVAKDTSGTRKNYWLRDVVSGTYFAVGGALGYAIYAGASTSFGVRPVFGICKA